MTDPDALAAALSESSRLRERIAELEADVVRLKAELESEREARDQEVYEIWESME